MKTIQLYQKKYQNQPVEGKEFEVLEPFGLEKALRQCQDVGYKPLFVPQLADARIASPKKARVWNNWYSTTSLRVTGRSKGNKLVVVYAHVPNYFSNPDNIAKAVRSVEDLIYYRTGTGGRIPEKEVHRLLKLEDDENVFVIDYNKLRNSSSGVIDVSEALEHPQTVPFLGGQARAEQYLQQYKKVRGNTIGIRHFDDLGEEFLGHLLFFGNNNKNALNDNCLFIGGRFVGVAQEMQQSLPKTHKRK